MGRIGRRAGQGFYDYDSDGNRSLWPELDQFKLRDLDTSIEDAQDRILFIQAIETLRCLNEGVLRSEAEANLGSIFGIGFPPYTGGAIQFIRGVGIEEFAARAKVLGNRYGARFVLDDSAFDILRNTASKAA
jgi:3-hydroxyacyl-CoA dehydrogenase / enoyl-CoA hydratase / 3-hydroxybutyryl-CoA epimerase